MTQSKAGSNTVLAEKLVTACDKGDTNTIQRLLKQGADPSGFMKYRGFPLTCAVNAGNLRAVIKLLVSAGADVNLGASAFHGSTPLELACQLGRLPIATLLVEHGADINKAGYWPPIRTAISHGQLESVKFLLKHGAHFKSSWLTQGMRHKTHVQMMQAMIDAGADVNHHENDDQPEIGHRGWVPLHSLARGWGTNGTRVLLKAGANPNAQLHQSKETPMMIAAAGTDCSGSEVNPGWNCHARQSQ